MIVVTTNHLCKPGQGEAARTRVEAGGAAMAQAPGFVFRYRLEREEEPDRIATVAAWTDRAAYAAFRAGRPAANPADPAGPFLAIRAEVFEVRAAIGAPPAVEVRRGGA